MRTNEEIVRILIDEKNKQNLSISELARRVDMAKSAISRYFNFSREFPLNRADDFAKVLGISTEYLLGISKEEVSNTPKNATPLVEEITKVSSRLEPPRQQIVLDTANLQLEEQQRIIEEAKKRERKILSLDKPPIDITKIPGYMPYEPDKMGMAPILGEIAAGYNILAEENFDGMMAVSPEYAGRDDIFWLQIKGNSMEPLIHDSSFGMFEHSDDIYDGRIGAVMGEDENWITVKRIYHNYDENGYLLGLTLVPENDECKTIQINEYNPARVIGTLLEVKQFF